MPFICTLPRRLALPSGAALLAAALPLAGSIAAACDVQIQQGRAHVGVLTGEATQNWERRYQVRRGGLVEIVNMNGPITILPADSDVAQVSAAITAKALTEAGAKELLALGRIEETSSTDRVKVETMVPRGRRGSYKVSYEVRVPAGVMAQASTTNGSLKASHLASGLKASLVNGSVDLTDMSGSLDVSNVNGSITASLASVFVPVRLETTNGRLSLTLPKTAGANLTARVVNGALTVTGLPIETSGQRRLKNLDVALNGGGPDVDLRATNGRITIEGK